MGMTFNKSQTKAKSITDQLLIIFTSENPPLQKTKDAHKPVSVTLEMSQVSLLQYKTLLLMKLVDSR